MKKYTSKLRLFALVLFLGSIEAKAEVLVAENKSSVSLFNNQENTGETVVIHVHGMVCDFCARGLEKTLKDREEVKELTISLEEKKVVLEMNPNMNLNDEEITRIINGNGISVVEIERSSVE